MGQELIDGIISGMVLIAGISAFVAFHGDEESLWTFAKWMAKAAIVALVLRMFII
jgi:hypothetical protein